MLKRYNSEIKPLITITSSIRKLLFEIPLGLLWHRLLLLPLTKSW